MALEAVPGFDLQPSAKQVPLSTNYITDFNFLNQYMPDVYEKEFDRYGDRTVSGFLRQMGAEMPYDSDLIKWSETGRLHTKYNQVTSAAAAGADEATLTIADTVNGNIGLRKGQTIILTALNGTGQNHATILDVDYGAGTIDVAYYRGAGQVFDAAVNCSLMIYGSEFRKGTNGMEGSVEADPVIFDNSGVIIKDKYAINGSDMAQIGWIAVPTGEGRDSYLWYLKSQHENRLRYEDYLESVGIEAVPAEAGSGVVTQTSNTQVGDKGSEGVFYVVGSRGNVWSGTPSTLEDFDSVVARLDKQGAIQENVIFLDRSFGNDIDDFLATLNGYNGTGAANAASFGLFDNDANMALNLGFTGFHRNYDFYKQSWKYLNDPTKRGDDITTAANSGKIYGLMCPAGSKTVYDKVLGKNAKRPFLHVRYRKSETTDRRYQTWVTGGQSANRTNDLDAMEVHFLSERATCTLGANNFMLFKD